MRVAPACNTLFCVCSLRAAAGEDAAIYTLARGYLSALFARSADSTRRFCVLLNGLSVTQATVVQSLQYAPTCLTVGNGYLAVGGQHGQIEVTELSSGVTLYRGSVGQSASNGAAHTAAYTLASPVQQPPRHVVCC